MKVSGGVGGLQDGEGAGPTRRARLRATSAKRRRRDASYPAARRYVWERSRGACEAPAHADDCSGLCQQVHHIRGRRVPNPHDTDNLIGLSEACHRKAHAEKSWAVRVGISQWIHREGET